MKIINHGGKLIWVGQIVIHLGRHMMLSIQQLISRQKNQIEDGDGIKKPLTVILIMHTQLKDMTEAMYVEIFGLQKMKNTQPSSYKISRDVAKMLLRTVISLKKWWRGWIRRFIWWKKLFFKSKTHFFNWTTYRFNWWTQRYFYRFLFWICNNCPCHNALKCARWWT